MSARHCGRCHECCIHLSTEERPAHIRCKHLTPIGRCEVYTERPKVCAEFRCMWALGLIKANLRPDQCGVIAQIVRNSLGGIGINIVECREGAIDALPDLVSHLRDFPCRLVQSEYAGGKVLAYSKDPTWMAHFREKNPDMWKAVVERAGGESEIKALELVGERDAPGCRP